jgi:hypothetical protein
MGFRVCAGHSFDAFGVCHSGTCSIRWYHIRDADEDCINKSGFAHIGALNATELCEIRRDKAQEDCACEAATRAVCGVSGSRDHDQTAV